MVSQQRSFHLIECPTGVSGPHARLIVSGRGVPHEALTAFYEALRQTSSAPTIHTLLHPVLSFFSFLEQQEQNGRVPECADAPSSPCLSGMGSGQFPPRTFWAGPPSEIQAAIRAYLLTQWGCRTRRKGLCEELLLAPLTKEAAQIHRFLSALRAFYHFAIARHDYCYHGNPVAAFRLPLRARLWQAIAPLSGFTRGPAPGKYELSSSVELCGDSRLSPAHSAGHLS
jgi:hypothetical protein